MYNAIKYLQLNDLSDDILDRSDDLEIYPLVVYTDSTFGAEGINKIMNDKFKNILREHPLSGLIVEGVSFVNLSYFEMHQEYLCNEIIDFFSLLRSYQAHVLKPEYSTASFEVYSRAYFAENKVVDLKSSYKLTENLHKVNPDLKGTK